MVMIVNIYFLDYEARVTNSWVHSLA